MQALEHLVPDNWVLAHRGRLAFVQWPWLTEGAILAADFPDVLQKRASTPIFPMSCRSEARPRAMSSSAGSPISSASSRLNLATRAEWPYVYGSRASMARARASMLEDDVVSSG